MDPPVPLKKKRCPKGTHVNKQGECVPTQVPIQKMIEEPTEEPIQDIIEPQINVPSRAVTKKKRCPKGTRVNKQGECISVNEPAPPVSATKNNITKKIRPTKAKESLLTIREPVEKPAEEPVEGIGALYPTLDDPNFNIKIAQRKEFFDTRYDGTIADLKTQSDKACKAEFELLPHQLFIKNFLSMQTPYSSILLNWGLGASKTCGAIGIAEEMRAYMKQIGMNKRILILAYPNVLDNFRLQLFDETKLKLENGLWNIQSCVGNSILNELNPTHLKDLNKSRLVANVNAIIKTYYDFKGYLKFSNEVANALKPYQEGDSRYIRKLQSMFNDHLIVIDEVHNIRQTRDNANLTTANYLYRIAKYAKNLRFVLLSATPMYNSYKEIIWLTNLMNVNDGRTEITSDQVFTSTGEFVKPTDRDELVGEELLRRKLTGYVSYVRGENPYTFPYRIYRSNVLEESEPKKTDKPYDKSDKPVHKYPPLYVKPLGDLQERVYHRVMEQIRGSFVAAISEAGSSVSSDNDDDVIMQGLETLDNIGYEKLRAPIQALNIVYGDVSEKPTEQKESGTENVEVQSNVEALIGRPGLLSIMEVSKEGRFTYRSGATHIFDPAHLVKYSHKMATILELIANSTGIVLIYSEFIDAGIVPMALALESAGFTRYAGGRHKNLPLLASHSGKGAETYAMITGNKLYSPHNKEELEALTSPDNKHGERIRVVLISKAGAEGLDFKNIRQIHIMEPWFNMSRIEQIIGRGVRNSSHCQLPFEERNVEIYMHATKVPGSVDMHLYELAFKKAKQIGQVSRLIKESSVDCILNRGQHNFTVEQLATIDSNKVIHIHSSHGDMEYSVGDRPYTAICDYLDTCPSKCKPDVDSESDLKGDVRYTYSTDYVHTNRIRIVERIRQLFQKQVYYPIDELVKAIQVQRFYPIEQIYASLTYLIENRNEFLVDSMGRLGNLINRGEIYAFQPVEISDEGSSIFDRTFPVEYKIPKIRMQLRNKFEEERKESETKADDHVVRYGEKDGTGDVVGEAASYQSIVDEIKRNIASIMEGREETEGAENPIKSVKKAVKDAKRLQTLMIGNRMVPQQQWTDYMHVGGIVPAMEEVFDMDFATIRRYMIHHAVDALPMKSKLALTTMTKNLQSMEDEVEDEIQTYLGRRIHRIKGVLGAGEAGAEYIILPNETLTISIFKRVDREWTEAEYSDIQIVKQHVIDPIHHSFDPLTQHVALLVGFFVVQTPKEASSPLIFKVKDYTKITTSGNAVGEDLKKAGKKRAIQLLKIALRILDLDKRSEVTKQDFDTPQYGQGGICMMVELLLRHSREHVTDKTKSKKLYLTPEEAVIVKIMSDKMKK